MNTTSLPQLAPLVILERSVSPFVILCCMDYGVCQYVTAQKRTVITYMVAAIPVSVRIGISFYRASHSSRKEIPQVSTNPGNSVYFPTCSLFIKKLDIIPFTKIANNI